MTDAVLRSTNSTLNIFAQLTAFVVSRVRRAIAAHRTRLALDALSDDLLRDVGITRSDVAYVADLLAAGEKDPTRDRLHNVNQAVAPTCAGNLCMAKRCAVRRGLQNAVIRVAFVAAVGLSLISVSAFAQDAQVKRGQYLVTLGNCTDCHTPGYFFGKPDTARFLGGSEVGFEIPGLGVFHGPNLTPDRETGLGQWSGDQIVAAITKGQRPDGRVLAPIMPWHAFASLTDQDARAIVAFLKSLLPVKNKVPGPFGPNEQPKSFVMKIVPPPGTTGEAAK
jgi:mono/diheme cytochrome c family protein